MALQGDLHDFQIDDILQLVLRKKHTGAIHINTPRIEGVIYFEDGEALHATVGDQLVGEKALIQILQWNEGSFAFEKNQRTTEQTIQASLESLNAEANRQSNEWERLRDLIPSLDIIVKFNSDQEGGQKPHISLQPKEWKVLSQVNGLRTVREIAVESNLSEFDTCKTLYGLLSSGLLSAVKEKETIPVTSEPAIPSSSETPESSDKIKSVQPQDPSKSSIWQNIIGGIKGKKEKDKEKEEIPIQPSTSSSDYENPSLKAMELFINTLLETYEKPKGLFSAVNFSMSLEQRIQKYEQKFPAMVHIQVKNNRIDSSYADSKVKKGSAEQQDILFGLGDIATDLLDEAKKSLTPRSAVNSYNAAFDEIFKENYDIRKLGLGAFVKKASL